MPIKYKNINDIYPWNAEKHMCVFIIIVWENSGKN